MKRPIYLDHNATTPLHPEVAAAMHPFIAGEFGNPSSGHAYGCGPRRAVAQARGQVAQLLQCDPEAILFTSGGTESNNHAIRGVAHALRHRGRHIVTSAVEHPAVLEVCRHLAGEGFETTRLPVDAAGRLDPATVARALRRDTILISVMHANNEVGTIQPIAEIAALARAHGVALHSDAAQSVGKIPCSVERLGVDLLSVAGHKLYAPKGVGALYLRAPLTITPLLFGAGQEGGRRAGTENVMLIAGLGAACDLARRDLAAEMLRQQALRERLRDAILAGAAGVRCNGDPRHHLPNTLSLSFQGVEANRLLEAIGGDVAASAGAACHAGALHASHVLRAMALPDEWAMGTLRFSLGRSNTAQEIDRAAAAVVAAVGRLRRGR